jgi:alkaline phosphatase
MIGDGMGVSQVYAGLTANKGSLNLERCRYVGFSKTYSADGGGHRNDTQFIIDEMLDFDRAVKVAFDFAEKMPNTLVIVTVDHETGGLAINGGSFATGEVEGAFTTKGHTAVMVSVFAFGDGVEAFAGIYQNVDIFSKVLALYGFNK